MTTKLQAMGYEAFFYEPAAGGHGYGKDHMEEATFTALGYTFLKEKSGRPDAARFLNVFDRT
jgi:prolyl oligopeptidase